MWCCVAEGGGEAAVCGSQWGSSPAGDQRSTAVAEAASVIIASIRTKIAPLLPPPPASSQLTRWPLILSLHPHTPLRMLRASHYQHPSSQRRTLSSSLLPKHEGFWPQLREIQTWSKSTGHWLLFWSRPRPLRWSVWQLVTAVVQCCTPPLQHTGWSSAG